ncbi:MAG: hypothetical protein ACRD16_06540 [Thermoanaerobaculia bacterium]
MQLAYFWADCSDGSHVAVNYAVHEDRVTGSIRRWSRDTRINTGRKFEVPAEQIASGDGGRPTMTLDGICTEPVRIVLDPRAVAESGFSWKTAA